MTPGRYVVLDVYVLYYTCCLCLRRSNENIKRSQVENYMYILGVVDNLYLESRRVLSSPRKSHYTDIGD